MRLDLRRARALKAKHRRVRASAQQRYRDPVAAGKAQRRAARERVAAYHQACLTTPLDHLLNALNSYRAGSMDVHDADRTVHQYHRANGELWKFCFAPGVDVETVARLIDEPADPIDWWQRAAIRDRR